MSGSFQDFSSNSIIQNELANVSQGRLTLTSNTPVLSGNVTGATAIYYTPYKGNQISIYDGNSWLVKTFSELTLSLSGLTADTIYDVFIYDNNGTLTLEAVAWSDSGAGTSARASALTYLDGVRVKASDNRKYLGSFRTTSTIGQTEFVNNNLPSSLLLKNEFNKLGLSLFLTEASAGHTYSTVAWRNYNNSDTYRFSLLAIDNENIEFSLNASVSSYLQVSVGINGTNWNNNFWGLMNTDTANIRASVFLSTVVNGFNNFQITESANSGLTGGSTQLSAYLKTHY